MNEKTTVVEYSKPEKTHSNTLAGVATALGSTGVVLALGNAIGSTVSRYFGNTGTVTPTVISPAQAPVVVSSQAPAVDAFCSAIPAVAGVLAQTAANRGQGCGYVTEKEMALVREISAEKSENAQLKAEKYTDSKVQEAVKEVMTALAITNNKICNLETHAAVTATGFEDYKQFANRVFVHQPIARMKECIVTTSNECCCPCSTSTAPTI